MDIIIDTALTADIPEIARMDGLLDGAMLPYLPAWMHMPEDHKDFSGFIDGTLGTILLARNDGRPIGMAVVTCGKVAGVMSLYVEEEFRGAGVGTMLLDRAAGMAKEWGSEFMSIGVLCGNERAHALYERKGFGDFRTTMLREL